MVKKIRNIFQTNLLFKGGLVLFIGSGFSNFGMYLFHLLMGRFLGPEDYGLLVSLISLSYFLTIPLGVFSLIIIKFISQEIENKAKTASFIKEFCKTTALYGAVFLILFLFLFPALKNLIKINSFLLYFGLGVFSYLGIFVTIYSSSLQGLMKFNRQAVLSVFNSWVKLLIAFFLVLVGFKVGGAVLGVVLGTLLTVVLGYLFISKELAFACLQQTSLRGLFKNIHSYSLAVFFSHVSLTSLYSVDIILVRHFLSPLEAGYYAVLSVYGKIIFFASSPIVSAMFPIVSSKQSLGQSYRKTFFTVLAFVCLVSVGISSLYFFFPSLMVKLLYGREYLDISSSLGLFAVFISLYSLSSLFLNFFLSIFKTKIIILPAVLAVVQIILICFYHGSIDQIIWVNILVSIILAAGLLSYFLKTERIKKYRLAK